MRRRWADQGSATVEAVVLLPLLLLIYLAVPYLRGLGGARHEAADEARACAWARALKGCHGTLPAVCAERADQSRVDHSGQEELSQRGDSGKLNDFTTKLSFLGPVLEEFLGETLYVRRSRETLGLGPADTVVEVRPRIVVLCNPRPIEFGQFLKDIFGKGYSDNQEQ